MCLGTVCGFAPLFPAGVCGVCGWAWVSACTPPFLVGVLGPVWLCARFACTPPFPVLVCGVGVPAGVGVAAASHHSLGRCWGVSVLVCSSRVVSCTFWLGVRCGGVWLGLGCCRAPPLLEWMMERVCVCVRAPLVPRLSWRGCAVWACVLGSGFRCAPPLLVALLGCVCGRACAPLAPCPSWGAACGVGMCGCCPGWGLPPPPLPFCHFLGGGRCDVSHPGFVVSVAGYPGLGSRGLCPPIPSHWGCVVCFCFFSVPAWCVSACSGCPFPWWAAAPGLVLPVLARCPLVPLWGSRLQCRLGGGFGRLLWCGWAVWWRWAVLPPPPLFFFLGGAACSSVCLPWAGARTGRLSVWSSGLLLVVTFCRALPRPHGSGWLCTRWARRPFLPG